MIPLLRSSGYQTAKETHDSKMEKSVLGMEALPIRVASALKEWPWRVMYDLHLLPSVKLIELERKSCQNPFGST